MLQRGGFGQEPEIVDEETNKNACLRPQCRLASGFPGLQCTGVNKDGCCLKCEENVMGGLSHMNTHTRSDSSRGDVESRMLR